MRGQQLALRGPRAAVEGQHIVVARVAHRGDAKRQFLGARIVVAEVHVAVPQPRNQGLALAVDNPGPLGGLDLGRGPNGGDRTLGHDHRLVRQEAPTVGVEHPHMGEGDGRIGRLDEGAIDRGRLGRHGGGLDLVQLLLLAGVGFRQPGDDLGESEELVMSIGPDGKRRRGHARDRPERDRLPRRALAHIRRGQLFGMRLAAGQQVQAMARRRQQPFQEPGVGVGGPALRNIERRAGIGGLAGVDGAFPARGLAVDGEGLGGVALRRHATNGQ